MKRTMGILLALLALVSLIWAAALAEEGEAVSPVYTDPYMVTLEPSTEMNILWLTKEACEGYVEYGPTPALGNRAEATLYQIEGLRSSATPEGYDPIPENNPEIEVYQLIANLENLEPGSVVYYRVTTVSGGEEYPGNRYFFKTAPESDEEFDFALLSDMQLKVKTKETLKFLGQQNKDFILFAGDLSNTPWKVGEWFDVEGCHQAPARRIAASLNACSSRRKTAI